jgi:hypothetical protein
VPDSLWPKPRKTREDFPTRAYVALGMGEVAKWLLDNLWAGLAIGATTGCAIAAVLTFLSHRLRNLNCIDEDALRVALQERQQLLLLCGDAKALADLAIQRHLGDALFLRRLREQPCYDILSLHFSEPFRLQISQQLNNREGNPTLAAACRKEMEQVEHALLATPPKCA